MSALVAEQCNVVLADIQPLAMNRIATEQCQKFSWAKTLCVPCNVTNQQEVQQLIRHADDFAASNHKNQNNSDESDDHLQNNHHPHYHYHPHHHASHNDSNQMATILINCAGITRDNWISKMTIDEWDDVLDINLKGTFLMCRSFLDASRMESMQYEEQKQQQKTSSILDCSIINVGSIVSELGNLGQANYAASKGGVLGLTRALAKEVASRNVRVNAVVPGFIETPMAQAVPDHVKERIIPKIPLKRFGQPEEVANLISFLASPKSSYITGECIHVSGMIAI